MSFILDALRKSETERQQQSGPGLADSQYRSAATKKGIWIPLLVLVLAVNAIVLVFVMSTGSDETVDSTNQSRAPATLAEPVIRPLAREIPRETVATANEVAPAEKEGTNTQSAPVAAQIDGGTKGAAEPIAAGVIQEGLPRLQQLVLAGQISVQPLHLDIHVYADARPERFVFINMKKYREGDNLAEGPSVEEITSTGVILAYRGDRFTLDRD